jgi:hypothetical protein
MFEALLLFAADSKGVVSGGPPRVTFKSVASRRVHWQLDPHTGDTASGNSTAPALQVTGTMPSRQSRRAPRPVDSTASDASCAVPVLTSGSCAVSGVDTDDHDDVSTVADSSSSGSDNDVNQPVEPEGVAAGYGAGSDLAARSSNDGDAGVRRPNRLPVGALAGDCMHPWTVIPDCHLHLQWPLQPATNEVDCGALVCYYMLTFLAMSALAWRHVPLSAPPGPTSAGVATSLRHGVSTVGSTAPAAGPVTLLPRSLNPHRTSAYSALLHASTVALTAVETRIVGPGVPGPRPTEPEPEAGSESGSISAPVGTSRVRLGTPGAGPVSLSGRLKLKRKRSGSSDFEFESAPAEPSASALAGCAVATSPLPPVPVAFAPSPIDTERLRELIAIELFLCEFRTK